MFRVIMLLSIFFSAFAIDDGPYVFYQEDQVEVSLIKNDKVKSKIFRIEKSPVKAFGKKLDLTNFKSDPSVFETEGDIFVLSDVHGQFELMKELLISAGVIKKNLKWNWGSNTLVICGDITDRGDKSTEALWLVHDLEIQASKENGRVFYLLGNHEINCIRNDKRYMNDKYLTTELLLNLEYGDLYAENTYFGKWLASKNIIIKINDILFLHGGIGEHFLKGELSLETINNVARENIFRDYEEIRQDSLPYLIFGSRGPLRNRDYFEDNADTMRISHHISELLNFYDASKIIVGHTTQDSVICLYNKQLFAIDAGIKEGMKAEGLLIDDENFIVITNQNKKKILLNNKGK